MMIDFIIPSCLQHDNMTAGSLAHAVHNSRPQSVFIDAFGQDQVDGVGVKEKKPAVQLIG